MKIAYLLLVHTNPDQVNQLVRSLDNGRNQFYIHVDKKANIAGQIIQAKNIKLIDQPISVKWGDFTLVEASIKLCQAALQSPEKFDYAILLSGQDYPIKSNMEIEDYLTKNNGAEFFKVRKLPFDEWEHHGGGMDRVKVYFPKFMIDRSLKTWYLRTYWIRLSKLLGLMRNSSFFKNYYGVSQWFCATRGAVEYLVGFLDDNPKILQYFKHTFIPDEILFNTIIMNSPFKDKVVPNDQRYLEWTDGNENPLVWRTKDMDKLLQQESLFARKFDVRVDSEIMNKLDEHRRQRDEELQGRRE